MLLAPTADGLRIKRPFTKICAVRWGPDYASFDRHASDCSRALDRKKAKKVGSRRRFVEGAGPQRSAGPVSADDDARGRSLRVDESEFAWRGSIRKETFACA
jgi:hypothetical protein